MRARKASNLLCGAVLAGLASSDVSTSLMVACTTRRVVATKAPASARVQVGSLHHLNMRIDIWVYRGIFMFSVCLGPWFLSHGVRGTCPHPITCDTV
jgi:hypothetical protein